MAVTDLTNLWSNVDTVTSDYTPGQGSEGLQSDIKLQGTQSFEKRVDNNSRAVGVSPDGTGSPTSPVDLSGRHACIFYLTLTPDILNNLSVLVYDGTTEETHCVVDTENVIITDGSEYTFPQTGGWVPFWADVDRTGETAGDLSGSGATTTTAVTHLGHYSTIGNIGGGNLANTYLDAIRYSNSDTGDNTPALYAITGTTTNTIEDLRTAEQNTTTGYRGLLVTRDGVDFFFGRLLIGRTADTTGTTATTFSVTDESFFFVSQRTMQSNWLGWKVDLGNASTTFSMTNCNFQSDRVTDAPVRPDLLFAGNSGSATITDCAILGLRTINIQSTVTMTGGSLDSIAMAQNSGTLSNVNITSRAASASAMGTNFTFGTGTGTISNCTVKPAGTSFGHFVEFDTAGSHDFTNLTFDDEYLGVTTGSITAAGNNNACVHNSSGGTVTINVLGGSIPTVRNSNGSTTVINVNVTVTVSGVLGNSEIKVLPTSGSPYSGNTLSDFTSPIATETVSADTNTGDGGSNFISYSNNGGFVQINANGTNTFSGVLTDGDAASTALADGDIVRVTIRDNADNSTLQLFDEFEVDGTPAPSASAILTKTSFATFTSVFGTALNSANSKTVTVEKVDARYQFSVASGTEIDFLTYRVGSNPILTIGQTITDDNKTFPLSQLGDRNYKDPA